MTLTTLASVFGPLVFKSSKSGTDDALALVRDAQTVLQLQQLIISENETIFTKIINNPKLTPDYMRLLQPRPEELPAPPALNTPTSRSASSTVVDVWQTVTSEDGQTVSSCFIMFDVL